jgi:hypothetical protein
MKRFPRRLHAPIERQLRDRTGQRGRLEAHRSLPGRLLVSLRPTSLGPEVDA